MIENWEDQSEDVRAIISQWQHYEWVRAKNIPCLNDDEGKLEIFAGQIEPSDIKQGELGDCYFLSSLSALSEYPERIEKLFESDQVNEQGIYGVKLTKNGIKQLVVLDDFLPCKDRSPVFSQANGNELWVLILEKAWAKLHGSYDKIIGGYAHQALRDLTGAPAFEFETSEEDTWKKILDADRKKFIIQAGISQDDEMEVAKF